MKEEIIQNQTEVTNDDWDLDVAKMQCALDDPDGCVMCQG